MNTSTKPSSFWVSWLTVVVVVTAASSFVPLLAPKLAQQGFSILVFGDPSYIGRLDEQAVRYIWFIHAVLGAVMFGWAILLLQIVRGPFLRGERQAWNMITISVFAWFIPGTGFSAWLGIWQNVVLNIIFCALFMVPLAGTFKIFHKRCI